MHTEADFTAAEAHEVNLKLFPAVPPAPSVKPFHVPLAVVDLQSMIDELWDMTMLRIVPHIDGANHVARIAELAEADLTLVQQAVRQLLRFGLVVLLDIFQYNAIYAPTSDIGYLLLSESMQEECTRYAASDEGSVSLETIVKLFASLSHGITLKAWALENHHLLEHINVRRFVTAGLMKGTIYRVHQYAVKETSGSGTPSTSSYDRQIDRFLDGTHCFDEICVTLSVSPQDLYSRLRSRKDVYIFER